MIVNGGVNGFVGVLYELVVTQAILSLDRETRIFDEGGAGEITFGGQIQVGKLDVLSQYFDTDIVISEDDALTIIQCKASDKGDNLTHGDLVQILIEGAKHLQKIRAASDNRSVLNFIIATNRPISQEIKDLNAQINEFRSKGFSQSSPCPMVLEKSKKIVRKSLDSMGKTPQSVLDWAKSLKTDSKDENGKTVKISLDTKLAESVAELAITASYALIREEEVQKRFRDSLRRYGLNESEIDKIDTLLKGELLEASRRGDNVVNVLRRHFSLDENRTLSLCPDELRTIEEPLIEHQWTRGEYGQTLEQTEQRSLPRAILANELINSLSDMITSASERGLVLIGDGGIGKSQLLFQIPKLVRKSRIGGSKEHLFSFVDCRPAIENMIERALLPFFEGHTYVQGHSNGTALADRLKSAFHACGTETLIWILVPNADELSSDELTDLLALITESLTSKPVFVLTARQYPWDTSGGPSNLKFLRALSVGMLDSAEIEDWIEEQGVSMQNFSRSVSPMRRGALVLERGSKAEVNIAELFGHPLSFQALQNWVYTKQERSQRRSDLQGLIRGDSGPTSDYMTYLRQSYVDRVFKHSKRFGVTKEAIDEIFANLFSRRDELPTIATAQWATDLCPNLGSSQQPDLVVRQFAQAGVLKYTDRQASRIEWAVPYQP